MQNLSYAAIFRPTVKRTALLYDITMVIGASIFIALSAQIAIPVPLSPVPITLQTLAVILTGAILGSRLGTLGVLAYLLEGSMGIPVFAQAHAGLIHLAGPTGGYLLGFVPAAFVTGLLVEQLKQKGFLWSFLIMSVGTIIIFIFGLLWLSLLFGQTNVLMLGLYPYLPGAFLKTGIAALIYSGSGKIISSIRIK
jgi:biotin transport system substrate-specific component